MLELTLIFVILVCGYQAMDIAQRRAIDGISTLRAEQAVKLRYSYNTVIKELERQMLNLHQHDAKANAAVLRILESAEVVAKQAEAFDIELKDIADNMRRDYFVDRSMRRIPHGEA